MAGCHWTLPWWPLPDPCRTALRQGPLCPVERRRQPSPHFAKTAGGYSSVLQSSLSFRIFLLYSYLDFFSCLAFSFGLSFLQNFYPHKTVARIAAGTAKRRSTAEYMCIDVWFPGA